MSIWTRWGEKGVDWLVPEENEISIFADLGYPAVLQSVLPWGTLQNSHWYQAGPYIRQYGIALGEVWNGDKSNTSYLISTIQGEYTDLSLIHISIKIIFM